MNGKKIGKKLAGFIYCYANPILVTSTFFLPIVFDLIENKNNVLTQEVLFLVQSISTVALFTFSFWKASLDIKKERKHRKNERSRSILSHINLLFDLKAELIRDSTYRPLAKNYNTPLYYNVHGFMREVCKNLRDTIASIIGTESEFVDVALIYKHHDSNNWKWIAGKSGTSGAKTLNKFVKEPTLFHYVIDSQQIVFNNNKEECKFYVPKRRDNFFNNKGSVMAMPLTYFNNKDGLIEFVLVVSTYGVRFVESKRKEDVNEFKEILVYEILPYYISLLQASFGEMYIRHIWRKKRNYGTK